MEKVILFLHETYFKTKYRHVFKIHFPFDKSIL